MHPALAETATNPDNVHNRFRRSTDGGWKAGAGTRRPSDMENVHNQDPVRGKKGKGSGHSDLDAKVKADLARLMNGLGLNDDVSTFLAKGLGDFGQDLFEQLKSDLKKAHGETGEEGPAFRDQVLDFATRLLNQVELLQNPPEELEGSEKIRFKEDGSLWLPENHGLRKLLEGLGFEQDDQGKNLNLGDQVKKVLRGFTQIDASSWLSIGAEVLKEVYGGSGDIKLRMAKGLQAGLRSFAREAVKAGVTSAAERRATAGDSTRTRNRNERTERTFGSGDDTRSGQIRRENASRKVVNGGEESSKKRTGSIEDAQTGRRNAATAMHALIGHLAESGKNGRVDDKRSQAAKTLADTVARRLEVDDNKVVKQLRGLAQSLVTGQKDWNAYANGVFDALDEFDAETRQDVAAPLRAMYSAVEATGDPNDEATGEMMALVVTSALSEVLAQTAGAAPAEGLKMAAQIADDLGKQHLGKLTEMLRNTAKGASGAQVVDLSDLPAPEGMQWPQVSEPVMAVAEQLIDSLGVSVEGGNVPVAADFMLALNRAVDEAGVELADPSDLKEPEAQLAVAEKLLERLVEDGSDKAKALLSALRGHQAMMAGSAGWAESLQVESRHLENLSRDGRVAAALLGGTAADKGAAIARVQEELDSLDGMLEGEDLEALDAAVASGEAPDSPAVRARLRQGQLERQLQALETDVAEAEELPPSVMSVVDEVALQMGIQEATAELGESQRLQVALQDPSDEHAAVLGEWEGRLQAHVNEHGDEEGDFGRDLLDGIRRARADGGLSPDAPVVEQLRQRRSGLRGELVEVFASEAADLESASSSVRDASRQSPKMEPRRLADSMFRGAVVQTWNQAGGGLKRSDVTYDPEAGDAFDRSWDATSWLGGRDKPKEGDVKWKKHQEDFETIKSILSDPALEFFDKMFIVMSLIVNKLRDKVEEDSIEQLDREELMWMNEQLAHEHQKEAEMAHRDVHEQGKNVDKAKAEYEKAKTAYEKAGEGERDGAEKDLVNARKKYDAEYTKFEGGKKKLAEIWEARDVHRVRIASDRRHVDIFAAKVKRNTHLVEMWMDLMKNFEDHKNRNLQRMLS
jgi:hypothetical protein